MRAREQDSILTQADQVRRIVSQFSSQLRNFQARATETGLTTDELREVIDVIVQAGETLVEYSGRLPEHLDRAIIDQLAANELVAEVQDARDTFQSLSDSFGQLNRSVIRQLVRGRLQGTGAAYEVWVERWGPDAGLALDAFNALAEEWAEPQPGRRGKFTDEDSLLAEMYYRAGMNQSQIARLIGLSQPAVGARLLRVDREIAERLLMSRLSEVGRREGWDLHGFDVRYREPQIRFDLLLERGEHDDDRRQIGVEFLVFPDRDERPLDNVIQGLRSAAEQWTYPRIQSDVLVAAYFFKEHLVAVFHIDELVDLMMNRTRAGRRGLRAADILETLHLNPSIDQALRRRYDIVLPPDPREQRT